MVAKKGPFGLLKKETFELLYVHCRAHLLQLAQVKAAKVKTIKNTLAVCNDLNTLFRKSPKKLKCDYWLK
jgi:hypothetical protein